MANYKQRYINTKFWNDSYISELDPIEKLLFIYFLTNGHTNISGVYEVPLKVVAIETGIDINMVKKVLNRLKDKIRYIDGIVVIRNFVKHQETGSELVRKGITNCLKDLDRNFLENIVNKGYYELDKYYIDTLSIQYAKVLNYSDSDSNLDSDLPTGANSEENTTTKTNKSSEDDFAGNPKLNREITEVIKTFEGINPACKRYYGNKTQRKACAELIESIGFERTIHIVRDTLPMSNKVAYMPSITTPLQLLERYATLESAITKAKNKTESKVKNFII